jgi:hypothetical protein
LHILIFKFFDSRREDRRLWTFLRIRIVKCRVFQVFSHLVINLISPTKSPYQKIKCCYIGTSLRSGNWSVSTHCSAKCSVQSNASLYTGIRLAAVLLQNNTSCKSFSSFNFGKMKRSNGSL